MGVVNRTKKPGPGTPPEVPVPATLDNPHKFVAAWIAKDRQSRAESKATGVSAWADIDAPEVCKRELCLYSALFTALENRGHRFERATLWSAICVIGEEKVEFVIRDHAFRRRVPMTKKELRDPDNIAKGLTTKWVEQSVGHLLMQATARYSSKKHQWADRFGRPLEVQLGEAILAFEAMAKAAAAAAEEAAREREQYRLSEERSAERRRLRRQEEAIWDDLKSMAGDWDEAERLRDFIDAVEKRLATPPNPPRAIRAWLKWARSRLVRLDPLARDDDALLASLPGIWRHRYFRRSRAAAHG